MKIEQHSALLAQHNLIVCDLSQYALIEVSGDEAEKYLQGQLTCDVNHLAQGVAVPTAHCDPKGKVSAFFYLLRADVNHFYLAIRQALLPSALDNLKKYAIFSKVTFNCADNKIIAIAGIEADSFIAQQNEKCGQNLVYFSHSISSTETRYFMLSNQDNEIATQPAEMWDVLDIQLGIPVLSQSSQGEFLPQALNIQCLNEAISFTKGCYIGQEMVARAKYRGANKRAMFTFIAKTDEDIVLGSEIGMRLSDSWRKTGRIISAVRFGKVFWLQIVLNNPIETDIVFRLSENVEILQYPLPYSLA